jgi:hypothetical protein
MSHPDPAAIASASNSKRAVGAIARWHRTIGVCAAIVLVFLAGTGLLLMSAEPLGLTTRKVESERLLDWYGIRPAPPPVSFEADGHWLTQFGMRLYFDTTEVPFAAGTLLGAFAVSSGGEQEILVASTAAVLILSSDGAVIERLGSEAGLPANLTAVGRALDGSIILANGSDYWRYQAAEGAFVSIPAEPTTWASAAEPPAAVLTTLTQAYRAGSLSLERVMLDLHSGRLFGRVGVWVVNLASVLLLFLAGSGIYMWLRRDTA